MLVKHGFFGGVGVDIHSKHMSIKEWPTKDRKDQVHAEQDNMVSWRSWFTTQAQAILYEHTLVSFIFKKCYCVFVSGNEDEVDQAPVVTGNNVGPVDPGEGSTGEMAAAPMPTMSGEKALSKRMQHMKNLCENVFDFET